MARIVLFRSDRSQAIRLCKDVVSLETVEQVMIREGSRRVIVPFDAGWDDFIARGGIDLPDREQPELQAREAFRCCATF